MPVDPPPFRRTRRLRRTKALRHFAAETRLSPDCFIEPRFVRHGEGERRPVPSMPGVVVNSVDTLLEDLSETVSAGIGAVLLFGIPLKKDALGKEAYDDDGIVPRAIRAVKREYPSLVVIADVCLCEYTDHGHCGLVENGVVVNDDSLPLHAKAAVAYARAGADVVAPSSMLDGQVAALRAALDAAGFTETAILSYAAKYASNLYGPFRDAAESRPSFGDRRGYQMDPANAREALREIEEDVREGADAVMVKPALSYLDVIARAREVVAVPLAAYHVSGEYAMVKAAGEKGWLDAEAVLLEHLTAIRRAGADRIITYAAREAARLLSA